MIYEGYAFTENENEECKRIKDRYNEIKHLRSEIAWDFTPSYRQTNFSAVFKKDSERMEQLKELTEKDVLILADSGNLCFGGSCKRQENGLYTGKILHGLKDKGVSMKKPNITKGEWEITRENSDELDVGVFDELRLGYYHIATVFECNGHDLIPNGRAISAVPDMIDALITAKRSLFGDYDAGDAVEEIEQALKKAGVNL